MARIITFPMGWHSYLQRYSTALKHYGVSIEQGDEFSDDALRRMSDSIDAVHFHWAEYLWSAKRFRERIKLILGVQKFCALARKRGIKIIWTVHNHWGHDTRGPGDYIGFATLARYADLVIVHSSWSASFVQRWFRPSGRMVVMPHGNFDGQFVPSQSRTETLGRVGLADDRPVVGMIGTIRGYKNCEVIVDVVARNKVGCQLLIAGKASEESYVRYLRERAKGGRHIVIVPGAVSDEEYGNLVHACDIVALPYRRITGSGALLSAWTLGRATIMADLPFFREYAPRNPSAGLILRDASASELASRIEELLRLPSEVREAAALAEADRYVWSEVVKPVAAAVLSWEK